jgi:hypothetical protein
MRAGLAMAMVMAIDALAASSAHAQVYDDPETEEALRVLDRDAREPPPDDPAARPPPAPPPPPPRARAAGLTLRRGTLGVTMTFEMNLSKGSAFEPASIAPDISYGVTDELTLSVVHSGFATTGFRGSAGSGLCITGEERGCGKLYNNAGVEALFDLVRGEFAAAGVVGLHLLSFDPQLLAARVGVQTSFRAGRAIGTFAPSVLVGITERDAGNKGGLFLPASIGTSVSPPLFLALGGGLATPFGDLGGGWTLRLGMIARYRVARSTFVAASLFLPRLAGGDSIAGTGLDARTANLWVTYLR